MAAWEIASFISLADNRQTQRVSLEKCGANFTDICALVTLFTLRYHVAQGVARWDVFVYT